MALPVRTREVLGIPLAMTDYEGAMDVMDGLIARRDPGYLCAVAVHAVMVAQDDPEMRGALVNATLTVPDGMPLVWTANALGERLSDRVYGPGLMERYCARSAERGHRMWLYGGRDDDALRALEDALHRRWPRIEVAGSWSPPFRPLTRREEDALVQRINADRPDVLWIGTGVPRQEKLMARLRPRLEVPVICAVGAAFDFIAGTVAQAPSWMQKRGLEWLYRMAHEPRRLAPRYLYYNPRFAWSAGRQVLRERARRG
jgi:N-acetylglucosaminyldiphosphoundecaprenol N-acetyl-beta-D-mannosaminyltransferase